MTLATARGTAGLSGPAAPPSPCIASALDEGLDKIKWLLSEASAQGAAIVCFPEAYLPGLRGQDFEVWPFDQTQQERALQAVAQWARMYAVATILDAELIEEIVTSMAEGPAEAGTSMLTDRRARRPLEADARNGAVARIGARHGIATPLNRAVTALLKAIHEDT